jgi:SPOR domain
MKFHSYLTVLVLFCSASVFGQTKPSFVDELNAPKSGQGTVKIHIDNNVKEMLGSPAGSSRNKDDNDTVQTKTSGTIIKCPGFKIQVFSGNDQRKSKNEAYSKQSQIKNLFPDVDTAVKFDSPFWRLRVGNYKTRDEAAHAMVEFRKAFPSFGKEMYVVKDQIALVVE